VRQAGWDEKWIGGQTVVELKPAIRTVAKAIADATSA
jgi:hypothetical protein